MNILQKLYIYIKKSVEADDKYVTFNSFLFIKHQISAAGFLVYTWRYQNKANYPVLRNSTHTGIHLLKYFILRKTLVQNS